MRLLKSAIFFTEKNRSFGMATPNQFNNEFCLHGSGYVQSNEVVVEQVFKKLSLGYLIIIID